MLVDLGRNDLGRVCEYGTVEVSSLMRIETYSTLIHIVSDVTGTLRDGVSPIEALRFETFGNSGRFATEPFAIHIPRLGRSVAVPADRTMLEALEAAGIAMISDCRRGECGLCALNIVETDGVVDHRDVFFSDEQKSEGRKLCTCVSRVSGGSITLDTPDRPR